MASRSRERWETERRRALDELERAHAAVFGQGVGRRMATQQINQAYAVLLSSHFQGFCRDLHSEAADHLARQVASGAARVVIAKLLLDSRKLDAGNPNPGNLGADYMRLGLELWPLLRLHDPRAPALAAGLQDLNTWRNAIAHQDFTKASLGGRSALRLADVRRWRSACDRLVRSIEAVVRGSLASLVGVPPW